MLSLIDVTVIYSSEYMRKYFQKMRWSAERVCIRWWFCLLVISDTMVTLGLKLKNYDVVIFVFDAAGGVNSSRSDRVIGREQYR